MSWDKIEQYLFDKYCVEGEDKEFCRLQKEHDTEVVNKVIDNLIDKACETDMSGMDFEYLKEQAEKLKVGVENENSV